MIATNYYCAISLGAAPLRYGFSPAPIVTQFNITKPSPAAQQDASRIGFLAGGLPLLPHEVHIAELSSSLESAISSLAVLKSKLSVQPESAGLATLVEQADTVLAANTHCSEQDLLDLLISKAQEGLGAPSPYLRPTLNYLSALEVGNKLATTNASGAFNIAEIKNTHRVLTVSMAVRGARGEFREHRGQSTSTSLYVCPPQFIASHMQDIENFISTPPPIPFVIRLAIVYAQIEMVMPFAYGTRDVARIIVQMMLAAEGYPAVPMSRALAENYGSLDSELIELRKSRDWKNWISFFLGHFSASAKTFCTLLDTVQQIRTSWNANLQVRRDAAARRIIDTLMIRPAVTVSQIRTSLGMSFQTANGALLSLMEHELVTVVPSGKSTKRNRIFLAQDVVKGIIEVMQPSS